MVEYIKLCSCFVINYNILHEKQHPAMRLTGCIYNSFVLIRFCTRRFFLQTAESQNCWGSLSISLSYNTDKQRLLVALYDCVNMKTIPEHAGNVFD